MFIDNYLHICELNGKSPTTVLKELKISNSVYDNWKKGAEPLNPTKKKIADYFGITIPQLMSGEKEKPSAVGEELSGMTLVKFPVIGSIAAGYNCCALEEYTGDYAYFSSEDLTAPADEYFVLRVKGNSMYPKLLEDDLVLVRRKPCVDSGKIAVVIYDGEEATIKKVNYVNGENWLELIPINPEYQPKRIENADLEQCCILGEVVKLQRDL